MANNAWIFDGYPVVLWSGKHCRFNRQNGSACLPRQFRRLDLGRRFLFLAIRLRRNQGCAQQTRFTKDPRKNWCQKAQVNHRCEISKRAKRFKLSFSLDFRFAIKPSQWQPAQFRCFSFLVSSFPSRNILDSSAFSESGASSTTFSKEVFGFFKVINLMPTVRQSKKQLTTSVSR